MDFVNNNNDNDQWQNETDDDQNSDVPQFQKEDDYLVPVTSSKNVKRSTILLTILFVAGAVCLLFMIKKAGPRQIDAAISEQDNIENAIAQLIGIRAELDSNTDQIVDKFYQLSNVNQVTVEQLKKNPFQNQLYGNIEDTNEDYMATAGRQMELKRQIEEKAKKLHLWTIIEPKTGSGWSCMIDDEILHEGDLIEGFCVTKIDEFSVQLVSNGIPVVLRIAE